MTSPNPKIRVGLYLRGDKLRPEAVTRELGIEPTQAWAKGDARPTSSSVQLIAKTGVWAFLSDRDSPNLSEHLHDVVSKINVKISPLLSTVGAEEAYLDIFVAKATDSDGGGTFEFDFTEHELRSISSLAISVRFTVAAVVQ